MDYFQIIPFEILTRNILASQNISILDIYHLYTYFYLYLPYLLV